MGLFSKDPNEQKARDLYRAATKTRRDHDGTRAGREEAEDVAREFEERADWIAPKGWGRR